MASPQTENGYTKIANELLEALCRAGLRGAEFSVVLWIARRSYGWSRKKTLPLGVKKMAEDLGAPVSSIKLALQVLLECGILERDQQGYGEYRFWVNKDYSKWLSTSQPGSQKLASRVANLASRVATLASPVASSGQPGSQFTDEPKERKKDKESIKGNGDTNIPSLGDLTAYAMEIGKSMDCRRFFDHYTANGWMRGKSPIADWRAVVRLWEGDGTQEPSVPEKPRCRCGRNGHFPTVLSMNGKVSVCAPCLELEQIEAGIL